jgi:tetratricopeptide (TPR) repeat protein
MSNKPDFIVDPYGNVEDVRGSKNSSESQSYPSQNSRAWGPSGGGLQESGRSSSKNPSTSGGGGTLIPIGLILTLILTMCRMLAGMSVQNRYSAAEVNSLKMGRLFYDIGNYEAAIGEFDRAIASAPDMGEAYNNRGLAYFAIGETNNALADFDKAIELMPNSGGTYSNRGAVYLSLGNYDQAIADLDKAIELSPDLAKAYHNRGLVYLSMGEADKAILDFDKAIELTPETSFIRQATMESRMPAGESPFGNGTLNGMLDDQSYADLPKTYASRAMAYLQKGDYERANADMEKAEALGFNLGFPPLTATQTPVLPEAGYWDGTVDYQ